MEEKMENTEKITMPATFQIEIFKTRPNTWQLHIYFRDYQVDNCGPFASIDDARQAAVEYMAGSNN